MHEKEKGWHHYKAQEADHTCSMEFSTQVMGTGSKRIKYTWWLTKLMRRIPSKRECPWSIDAHRCHVSCQMEQRRASRWGSQRPREQCCTTPALQRHSSP